MANNFNIEQFLDLTAYEQFRNSLRKGAGGRRYDVCLMNPPYSGGTRPGDGLYVDFINKCIEISNNLISVNPIEMLITHIKGGALKNKTAELVDNINKYKTEIVQVEKNYFDAAIKTELAILYMNMTEESDDIKISYHNKDYNFKSHEAIHLIDSDYFDEFAKKVIKYMTNENVNSFIDFKYPKLYTKDKDISISKDNIFNYLHTPVKNVPLKINTTIMEKNPDKTALYIYLYKFDASFPTVLYKTTSNEAIKYDEERFKQGRFLYMTFKNTNDGIEKSKNVCKYLKSKFVRLIVKMSGKYFHYYTRYMFMPYLDFSKSYSEEELFNMIGMEYNEEEINKILND